MGISFSELDVRNEIAAAVIAARGVFRRRDAGQMGRWQWQETLRSSQMSDQSTASKVARIVPLNVDPLLRIYVSLLKEG
ncbi:hypothetical protein J2Z19_002773 [Ensifer adhaerens]|uniref:Uncharacterized protein n=1 Tax=Ensifer adhaerens TaxID=106592 RepID=A0ACC5SVZ6_ENSAD|nr:hypothetical protein [Ensifer adhaerens]MBP1873061.1 hypothetical protein [Ensifer adhaerens]